MISLSIHMPGRKSLVYKFKLFRSFKFFFVKVGQILIPFATGKVTNNYYRFI